MKRRYHLRWPFLIYCVLTLLVALAAMNGGLNLLYWVFGVMVSGLLLSGTVSGAMMMGLRVRRTLPAHGVVDQPLVVRYIVNNRRRLLPVFNVHFEECVVADRPSWDRLMSAARASVMHIGPREIVHGEAEFRPTRRGEAWFDGVRMWTTFPFGIIRKSITRSQPQRLLVHPRLYVLRRKVLDAIAPPGAVGLKITAQAGSGDDYYGLREFRPGDSMRHIAWKRTANRDELISIERTRPNPPRIRVVLDLTSPADESTSGDALRELEEQAISLAASIVHAADFAGFEIGLTILGTDRLPIAIRRSHWHCNRLMAALAAIDLESPRSTVRTQPIVEPSRAGVVVVHPDRVNPAVATSSGGGEAWHFTARQLPHLVVATATPVTTASAAGAPSDAPERSEPCEPGTAA